MDLKITEKKEEPLSSRIQLTGELDFEAATPSYKEVKKKIASSLSCDEKLIVIRHIYTKFGIRKADFLAYLYNKEEDMKKIEPKKKEKKGAKPEEEEKPEEKKEESKESKEEKKEEKKEETTEKKT
ncbi:hypothetical protein ISS05_01690 [Candidatus Woesearchaeota archaeon]|nr:hypothetical protein [Candidatus Woesearchaeota archaeon]